MEDSSAQGTTASGGSGSPSKRMSLPPTFEQQRTGQRASLPPRPNMAARHSKRLTLNFPINIPPPASSATPSDHSPSPMMTPATTTQSSGYPSPSLSSNTIPAAGDAGDENSNFLVALAAQERKVLELREELHRAEADLVTLKRQWALNEKGRKHTQIKHRAEAMKPLRNPEQDPEVAEKGSAEAKIESADPVLQSQTRMSKELERRASLKKPVSGNGAVSSNGRRVFQSSRHARTLSLLSPEMLGPNFQNSFPQPAELVEGGKPDTERTARHPRSATLPSLERGEEATTTSRARRTNPASDEDKAVWRRSMPMPPPPHDAIVRTGKQMASDFRDGLWTFLEDIRQATVGDEGINGTESRTMQQPSTAARSPRMSNGSRSGSPRNRERPTGGLKSTGSSASRVNQKSKHGKTSTPTDTDVSFWNEFGVDTPGQTTASGNPAGPTAKTTRNETKESDDSTLNDVVGDWDTWDTPVKSHTPSSSRSTFNSKRDHSPSSDMSSPRTSTSSRNQDSDKINNADAIPWPSLTKLRPSSLTKTASNLMDEWERSLTTSPEPGASP
ncbi:hypothetical protein FQN54_009836 [Arachnomyces sp. PD_36]|nr:hypothetical protein FQN54_009836 [Arachnomyces sp. PD_36]